MKRAMNKKIKILIGILVIGILLINGWCIWGNQQIQDYKTDKKYCQKDQDCGCSTCGCLNFYWKDKIECKSTYEGTVCDKVGCVCKDNQCVLSENKYCEKDEDCIFTQCCGCARECNRKCNIKPEATPCRCENNQCVPAEFKQIVITTDKTEYEQGETVKITVKNNLDKPIWHYDWSEFGCVGGFSIGKREEEYKEFYLLATEECSSSIVKLEPRSEKVYKLNLSLSTLTRKHWEEHNVKLLGTFKLKFNYFLNETSAREYHINEAITIYSNEFTIK